MVALHLIYHKMYQAVKRFFGQFAFSLEATSMVGAAGAGAIAAWPYSNPVYHKSSQAVKRFFQHANTRTIAKNPAGLILVFRLVSRALFYPTVILAGAFIAVKMMPVPVASGRGLAYSHLGG